MEGKIRFRKVDLDESWEKGMPRENAIEVNIGKEAHVWEGDIHYHGRLLNYCGNGIYRFYKLNGTGKIVGEIELNCADLTNLVVVDEGLIHKGSGGF